MGSRRLLIAAAVVVLLIPTPASACVRIPEVEVGCETNAETDEDGFWTGPVAQTMYGVIGLAGMVGGGLIGWNRVRQRRKTLRQFLKEADDAYVISKNEPQAGIERLVGLRAELQVRHEHAKIDDAQFLALDRRIADYVAKLRVIDIELRFPDLHVDLVREIRHVAQDGHLSLADVKRIEKLAGTLRIEAPTRRALGLYLHAWAGNDMQVVPVKAILAPPVL